MANLAAGVFAPLASEAWTLVEGLRKSVVVVHSGYGHGAGVIWDSTGLIITNHHVAGRDRAEVELIDGRRLVATVIGRDPRNDLAALRVDEQHLPAVPVGDSKALRLGELTIAVGHPFGVRGTATLGIISGIGRTAWAGYSQREVVQADVVLAPGNSGGPLVNAAGQVVGIASMVVSPGIALAVPSHIVNRFVATLSGTKPYIGVTVRPVVLQEARNNGYAAGYRQGLMLLEVQSGSPAEAAGLLPGDVLLTLNDRTIEDPADLLEHVANTGEKQPLHMDLLRGGRISRHNVYPQAQRV